MTTRNTPFRRWTAALAATAVAMVGSVVVSQTTAEAAPKVTEIDTASLAWTYLDTDTDPAAGGDNPDAWTAVAFDDAAWKTGSASFGALRGQIGELNGGFTPKTLLNQYQEGTTNNVPAFFFRTKVTLDQAAVERAVSLSAALRYDDAASLFVNGTYVGGGDDAELQQNPQRNTTHGGSNASAPKLATVSIPTELLVAGENVFSVRLHNGRPSSSDVFFDLESLTLNTELTWAEQLRESALTNVVLGTGTDGSERNLVWFTDEAHNGSPVVELVPAALLVDGQFPASGATRLSGDQIRTEKAGQGGSRGFEAWSHKTEFTGLEANTSYAYRIGHDGGSGVEWLGQWTFTTESGADEWSFFFIGDAQIGSRSGHRGANPIARTWEADSAGWKHTLELATQTFPEIKTLVSAGDQVESNSRLLPSQLDTSANATELEYLGYTYPEQLKTLQHAPTLGNHDWYVGARDTYTQHYNIPNFDELTKNHWWKQNNMLFLHLNTERNSIDEGHGDEHDAWMTKTIAAHGQDVDHIAVVMHRPIYSVGSTHSTSGTTDRVRKIFTPLFKKHGIHVLLTGHDHTYARSHAADNFYPGTYVGPDNWVDPSGEVINLGTGADAPKEVFLEGGQLVSLVANTSSGSKYYDIKEEAKHPYVAVQNQDFVPNYSVVDVDACSVTYRTFRTQAVGEHEANSIVDEVRVNVPEARPTLEDPADLTVTVSEAAALDLTQGVEYQSCNSERFPLEVSGEVNPEIIGDPQTVRYTLAAGTPWEVSVERTVTVQPDPEPVVAEITLDKTEAYAGDEVTITGSGFPADTEVTLELHSTPVVLTKVTADAAGRFQATVQIPATVTAGAHELVATAANGTQVRVPFTVLAQQPAGSNAVGKVPSGIGDTGEAVPLSGSGKAPGGLANTGQSTAGLMVAGGVMLAAAAGLLFGRRLQRQRSAE